MIGNRLRVTLFFVLFCGTTCGNATANAQTLALVGGSVYASSEAAPLPDAVVVTSGGGHRRNRQPRRCPDSCGCARH
jgi:hypothetical protein